MSFRSNEFGVIPRQGFLAIDRQIIDTLTDFVPTERYAMRDVILTDGGIPQVVEREERTPLTANIQYREIRERQPLQDIDIECYPIPQSLGMSRWFNPKMERAYAAPTKPPELADIAQENLDIGEFSFFVPCEPTKKDLRTFEKKYWDNLLSFGYYRMYHSPEVTITAAEWGASTFGETFTTPNFRQMYKLRHQEITKAATAYLFDREVYLTGQGIVDPNDATEEQENMLAELDNILHLKEMHGAKIESIISVGEAVTLYGENHGLAQSRAMQKVNKITLDAPSTWARAHRLLDNYIEQISCGQGSSVIPAAPSAYGSNPVQKFKYIPENSSIRHLLYEDKTKKIWQTLDPSLVIIENTDLVISPDGRQEMKVEEKGWYTTHISNICFRYLQTQGIPNHYLKSDLSTYQSPRFWAFKLDMLPIKIVVRHQPYEPSYSGKEYGETFQTPIVEIFENNRLYGNPLLVVNHEEETISRFHPNRPQSPENRVDDDRPIRELGHLMVHRWNEATELASSAALALRKAWAYDNIALVDIEFECGLTDWDEVLLGGTIGPECWRLWRDNDPAKPLDRQFFKNKRDPLEIIELYDSIVLQTLGWFL